MRGRGNYWLAARRKKKYAPEIERIMNEYDWDKVHKVMTFLDWKWGSGPGGTLEIPNVDRLKKRAKEMLEDVAGSAGWMSLWCGGFIADKMTEDGELALHFSIESGPCY